MTFKRGTPLFNRLNNRTMLPNWCRVVSQILLRGRISQSVAAFGAAIWLGFAVLTASAQTDPVRIVALGDSLTAGYGVAEQESFPVRLQAALAAKGIRAAISNAGVSGDTASGGLARLDWSIPGDTQGVIVELGANDALRGIDPAVTRKALDDILASLKQRGIPVLLAGMRAPPNMGADYAAKFDAIYADLAKEYGVLLYPFFLEGVASERALNQGDGIHPTAAGVDVIVKGILPKVEELIRQATPNNP
jgi:acyl-CoA thioesterase I